MNKMILANLKIIKDAGIPNFYDPVFGYDVFKLDDWMQTPEGKSVEEMIIEKYGKEVSEAIQALFSPGLIKFINDL